MRTGRRLRVLCLAPLVGVAVLAVASLGAASSGSAQAESHENRHRLSEPIGDRVVLDGARLPFEERIAPRRKAAGAGPHADVLCTYLERGSPGPVDNELQITTNDYVGEVAISRNGEALVVTEDAGDPLPCPGTSTPAVTNLDRISLRVSRESVDSLILDLRTGTLAPGATVEPDGTSEIEVSMIEAPGTVLSVIGTSASEVIELGSLGGGNFGANLNGAAEQASDADVTGRNAFVSLVLGGGADRVDPIGNAEFATRAFNFAFGAIGGGGDDVLVGNDRRNFLWGGRGRDELIGAGLPDQLLGGPDRDRIDARDRVRDLVDCGRGRDIVRADRVDRRRHCE